MSHQQTRRHQLGLALLAIGIAAMACTGTSDGADAIEASGMPRLTRIDSLVLEETAAVTLGDASHFTVSDTDVWVVDRQNGRLVRFARDGRLRGTFGRKGSGPGELTMGGPIALIGDSSVAVVETARAAVVRFRTADGRPEPELPLREQALVMQLQSVGDTIWAGVMGLTNHTGVRRIPLDGGEIRSSVPHPPEFTPQSQAHWSLPYDVALRFGDTTLVAYAASHRIVLHRDDGGIDTLVVPQVRRRGVPVDLVERMQAGAYRELVGGADGVVSVPIAAHRLPDGAVALVHMEVDIPPEAGLATGERPAYRAYLTVVRADFDAACVDAPIPIGDSSGPPSLAFRGDTLFTLDQQIAGDRAVPVLSRHRIETAGCAWMPVPRGAAPYPAG